MVTLWHFPKHRYLMSTSKLLGKYKGALPIRLLVTVPEPCVENQQPLNKFKQLPQLVTDLFLLSKRVVSCQTVQGSEHAIPLHQLNIDCLAGAVFLLKSANSVTA